MLVCLDIVVILLCGIGVRAHHAFCNLFVGLAVLTVVKMLDEDGIVMILLVFASK